MKRLDDLLEAHLPADVAAEVREEMAQRSRAFAFAEGAQKLRAYAESALKLVEHVEEIMWGVDDEDLTTLHQMISKLRAAHELRLSLALGLDLAALGNGAAS